MSPRPLCRTQDVVRAWENFNDVESAQPVGNSALESWPFEQPSLYHEPDFVGVLSSAYLNGASD